MPRDFHPEMWFLVWDFAWGCRPKKHPLLDLACILDIQRSIPPVLLRDRVPPIGWKWTSLNCLYQLFPPNPFKRGNPYRPFVSVDSDFLIWTAIPTLIVSMLSAEALRKLKTYRAVMERRVGRHYERGILEWNTSANEFFLPVSTLLPQDFVKKPWGPTFNFLVLGQLRETLFLTVALP